MTILQTLRKPVSIPVWLILCVGIINLLAVAVWVLARIEV